MVTVDQLPTTMRAIRQRGYGDAGMWSLGEEPVPTPGPGRVLVRVEAAGVDQGTLHLLTGKPYLLRLVFGLRAPKRVVPGLDLAGRVVAVGDGVARIRVGDEVFGIGEGSYAEYATALESKLERRPDCWTAAQAAAVPVSGLTAWQALHTAAARGRRSAGAGDRSVRRGRQLRRADRRRGRSAGDRRLQRGQGRLRPRAGGRAGDRLPGAGRGRPRGGVRRRAGHQRTLDPAAPPSADGARWRRRARRRRRQEPGVRPLRTLPAGPGLDARRGSEVRDARRQGAVQRPHRAGRSGRGGPADAGRRRVYPLADAAAAITALAAGEVRGKVVLSVGPGTMSP